MSLKMQKRKEAILFSDSINAIVGVAPSSFAVELSKKWAENSIEWQEMVQQLVAYHSVVASQI